jgi:hypothetical protein
MSSRGLRHSSGPLRRMIVGACPRTWPTRHQQPSVTRRACDRECSAATPTPAPTPTPTPTPTPSPTVGVYYVWGGTNYTQYLGYFSCVFCTELSADSINNQFGSYGNLFSTTSIRNQFSLYGSQFSTDSACNQLASNPPRVYNSNRSVYYGELTVNQFRPATIGTFVSWLQNDVCRH